MSRLILASSSPRRRLLLSAAGIPFTVRSPQTDESPNAGEEPDRMVARLARDKALAVDAERDTVVLGADTTVVLDGSILGKPVTEQAAAEMLRSISDRTHLVLTGWALAKAGEIIDGAVEPSLVTMRRISWEEARAYAASGEPLDKAGAYALQGNGARYVKAVAGSRSNIIGLPIRPVVTALDRAGVSVTRSSRSQSIG